MADQKRIPEIQLTATASRPLGQLQQHAKWDTSPRLNAPGNGLAQGMFDGHRPPQVIPRMRVVVQLQQLVQHRERRRSWVSVTLQSGQAASTPSIPPRGSSCPSFEHAGTGSGSADLAARLAAVSGRVYDLLHTTGWRVPDTR